MKVRRARESTINLQWPMNNREQNRMEAHLRRQKSMGVISERLKQAKEQKRREEASDE